MILTDLENNFPIRTIEANVLRGRALNLRYLDLDGEHVATIIIYNDNVVNDFLSGNLDFRDMYNMYLGGELKSS